MTWTKFGRGAVGIRGNGTREEGIRYVSLRRTPYADLDSLKSALRSAHCLVRCADPDALAMPQRVAICSGSDVLRGAGRRIAAGSYGRLLNINVQP